MTDPQDPTTPPPAAAEVPVAPAAPAAAPAYSAPAYAAAPPAYAGAAPVGTVPGKTLGIVALIVVFFFSLIGLILGYVARSQSKAAGVANTPAKVAIILGWVFLVLGIIVGIVAAVLFTQGIGALQEACTQLGDGVWELENGTTITCGGN